MSNPYVTRLGRARRYLRRQPACKEPAQPHPFKTCNARVAELLSMDHLPELVHPLRDAFMAIYRDTAHPLHVRMSSGRKHWYVRDFELNEIALECGYAALGARDLGATRLVATLIEMTDFDGPKTKRFLATSAAANGEWGAAEEFYKQSAKKGTRLNPNSIRWLHQEQTFLKLDGQLRDLGVTWIDLSSARRSILRQRALDQWWKALLKSGRIAEPEYGPALRTIAQLRQTITSLGPSSAIAAEAQTMGLKNFRNYLAGKSICLIANSGMLRDHELGARIDSYDLVMRFNSFVIGPVHTGSRTDIHAAVHLYHYNLEVPVDVRILVSGKRNLWSDSIHEKIRPGAQKFVGDGSMHWPAVQLGLIPTKGPIPTVGFNMMRTLDHLDVNPVIDLIGFDFYSSGMHRVEDAMSVPHSKSHNSEAEKEWVMANAHNVTDTVISLR